MCEPLEEKGCRIHSKLLYERNVITIGHSVPSHNV